MAVTSSPRSAGRTSFEPLDGANSARILAAILLSVIFEPLLSGAAIDGGILSDDESEKWASGDDGSTSFDAESETLVSKTVPEGDGNTVLLPVPVGVADLAPWFEVPERAPGTSGSGTGDSESPVAGFGSPNCTRID